MKIRLGFVTNSSSSSFVVSKRFLTPDQVGLLLDYPRLAAAASGDFEECRIIGESYEGEIWFGDSWRTGETETEVYGDTLMDNGAMDAFLRMIGVPHDMVRWGRLGGREG